MELKERSPSLALFLQVTSGTGWRETAVWWPDRSTPALCMSLLTLTASLLWSHLVFSCDSELRKYHIWSPIRGSMWSEVLCSSGYCHCCYLGCCFYIGYCFFFNYIRITILPHTLFKKPRLWLNLLWLYQTFKCLGTTPFNRSLFVSLTFSPHSFLNSFFFSSLFFSLQYVTLCVSVSLYWEMIYLSESLPLSAFNCKCLVHNCPLPCCQTLSAS